MVIKSSDIIRKDFSENYSENVNPVIVKELERVGFVKKNIKDQERTSKNIFLKSLVIFREELTKYYYKKIMI